MILYYNTKYKITLNTKQ